MANRIAMVAIALILVTSAVSVVATADTGNGQKAMELGNFSFNDNTTTSTILNLTYSNDNVNAVVANSVVTNGTASSILSLSNSDVSHKNLNNVTLFTSGSENVLLLATTGSSLLSKPTMTFNLNGNVSKVTLTQSQQAYVQQHSSSQLVNFASNQMYRVTENNASFYLFSNTGSTLTGNTVVYHNSNFVSGDNLLVGVSSAGWLKNTIENEVGKAARSFSYNNTTGMLTGSFVSLQFNASTGVINNYTDSLSNATVFNEISAKGNGSMGNGYPGPVFQALQPIVVGSVFYYANNTVVYQVHNNPVELSNFFLSNGTMTFNASSNLNVSVYNPPKYDVNRENVNANYTNISNVDLGDQYDVQSSSTVVFLHNSTFTASLFVNGGNVSVSGNTIEVNATNVAHITFVAPPGLQKEKKDVQDALQYAINHGKLAAMVVLGAPGQNNSNVSVNYNGSMQILVQNVTSNKVFVQVSSKMHEGTNFAVFVPNNVISNLSKISLKFDNQTITLTKNMGAVLNATSSVNASFYYVQVNGGTLVVIHVPHFSTHTIEIVNGSISTGNTPRIHQGDTLYIGLGIVAVIALVAGVSLRRRK